jgi:hypothetical protein
VPDKSDRDFVLPRCLYNHDHFCQARVVGGDMPLVLRDADSCKAMVRVRAGTTETINSHESEKENIFRLRLLITCTFPHSPSFYIRLVSSLSRAPQRESSGYTWWISKTQRELTDDVDEGLEVQKCGRLVGSQTSGWTNLITVPLMVFNVQRSTFNLHLGTGLLQASYSRTIKSSNTSTTKGDAVCF